MTTPKTSRRAVLASLAAAPVAGLPALALSEGAPDPIFAAIERHKVAWGVFNDGCSITDEVLAEQQGRIVTPEDEATWERISAAEIAAMNALAETPPQTVAGLLAALDYLRAFTDDVEDGSSLDRFIQTAVDNAGLLEGAA